MTWLIALLLGLGAAAAEPPPSSRADLVERPLFSPSRRAPVQAPATKLSSASLRLTGLVADGKGKTVALIRTEEQKNEVRVGPGGSLNGWKIASVDGHGIDLASGEHHMRVTLKQVIPPAGEE
jgi:hypothetical protein